MKTRSQTNKIDIDFDEASAAWMANKVRRNAMVYYKCTAMQKSGKPCTRISSNEETAKHPDRSQLCTQHARCTSQAQAQKSPSLADGSAGVGFAGSLA